MSVKPQVSTHSANQSVTTNWNPHWQSALRPVLISQIQNAEYDPNVAQGHGSKFKIGGHYVLDVTLVAHVVRTRYEEEMAPIDNGTGGDNERTGTTMYQLEDGTGTAPLMAFETQKADSYEDRSHYEPFYARFVGRLKASPRDSRLRSLTVYRMRRITDPNEIYLHFVDVMSVSLAYTRGNLPTSPSSTSSTVIERTTSRSHGGSAVGTPGNVTSSGDGTRVEATSAQEPITPGRFGHQSTNHRSHSTTLYDPESISQASPRRSAPVPYAQEIDTESISSALSSPAWGSGQSNSGYTPTRISRSGQSGTNQSSSSGYISTRRRRTEDNVRANTGMHAVASSSNVTLDHEGTAAISGRYPEYDSSIDSLSRQMPELDISPKRSRRDPYDNLTTLQRNLLVQLENAEMANNYPKGDKTSVPIANLIQGYRLQFNRKSPRTADEIGDALDCLVDEGYIATDDRGGSYYIVDGGVKYPLSQL